jgi:hypothetical protein
MGGIVANPITLDEIKPVPGVPMSIVANHPRLAEQLANSLYFQVLPTNKGNIYIGNRTLNVGALTGIIARLRPPTANSLPEVAWDIPTQPNPFWLNDYLIDCDQLGDGVIVSFMVY